MHKEAYDWVHNAIKSVSILDIGGADINGSIKNLFPNWSYVSIDVRPGNNVDVVGDASEWKADGRKFDVIVCCEVFEHTSKWMKIIENVADCLLKENGLFVGTMAGTGREPHKCDGNPLLDDSEYYKNIEEHELVKALRDNQFIEIHVDRLNSDLRFIARKPVKVQ